MINYKNDCHSIHHPAISSDKKQENTSATPPRPCTRLKNALELRCCETNWNISLKSRLQIIIVGQLILETRP